MPNSRSDRSSPPGLCIASLLLMAALAAVLAQPRAALSHEIAPGVADATIGPERTEIEISLSLETILAGIDLRHGVESTEHPTVAEYDRLRALPPAELAEAFFDYWPQMAERLMVQGPEGPANLTLQHVDAPPVGDVAFPRRSNILIIAETPAPVRIGWDPAFGTLIVRQMGLPIEQAYTGALAGGVLSPPLSVGGTGSASAGETAAVFAEAGFRSIIPRGLDHILFVLGLFFLSPLLRPLLWQLAAFTLAHSIAFALAALGVLSVPGAIIAPMVAASIVYVAAENLFTPRLQPWRPALVFGFGLLHGLAFANALAETAFGAAGPSSGSAALAPLSFLIGVEAALLLVLALAFLAVGLWFARASWYRPLIAVPASAAMALIGAVWFVERTVL